MRDAGWKLPASETGWLGTGWLRARLAGWGDGGVVQTGRARLAASETGAVDARDMRKPPASKTGTVDACDMRKPPASETAVDARDMRKPPASKTGAMEARDMRKSPFWRTSEQLTPVYADRGNIVSQTCFRQASDPPSDTEPPAKAQRRPRLHTPATNPPNLPSTRVQLTTWFFFFAC